LYIREIKRLEITNSNENISNGNKIALKSRKYTSSIQIDSKLNIKQDIIYAMSV